MLETIDDTPAPNNNKTVQSPLFTPGLPISVHMNPTPKGCSLNPEHRNTRHTRPGSTKDLPTSQTTAAVPANAAHRTTKKPTPTTLTTPHHNRAPHQSTTTGPQHHPPHQTGPPPSQTTHPTDAKPPQPADHRPDDPRGSPLLVSSVCHHITLTLIAPVPPA